MNNDFTPFEIFILDRLLNSGEDNCGKNCAYGSMTELCSAILPDRKIDDEICYRDIREYFEQHKEDL